MLVSHLLLARAHLQSMKTDIEFLSRHSLFSAKDWFGDNRYQSSLPLRLRGTVLGR